jgi:DHA2 family methylenomycin A resistance protein-like MFS transporter
MCAGYFLVLLDVTIVNVALPSIGADLHADVSGLQWIVDGYAIALASLLLAGGTIGDLAGHKRVVLTGLAVFGVASLGCALAPSVAVLVPARVVQGVGAALLLPGTLAIISQAFPERRAQARAIGIWAGVGSAALPAGPLLGGMLVQVFGWRAVFIVNVPIVVLAGLVVSRVIHETRESRTRRLDTVGVVLGGLLLASITLAVIESGRGGSTVIALASAGSAVGLLTAFLLAENAARDPMLPLGLFRRPGFSAANATAMIMNLGTLGLLFLLTLYLQVVQHRSPLQAGVALIPLFAPLTLLAPVAGRVTARFGPRLPMASGLLVAAAGVAAMVRVEPDSTYLTVLAAMLAWGIGLGLLTPAVVAAAVSAVEPDRAGLASGVNNTARQAGGAIGIAVFGAVAGPASSTGSFIDGLHVMGLATAALFLIAAVVTVAFIRPAQDEPHLA